MKITNHLGQTLTIESTGPSLPQTTVTDNNGQVILTVKQTAVNESLAPLTTALNTIVTAFVAPVDG